MAKFRVLLQNIHETLNIVLRIVWNIFIALLLQQQILKIQS